MDAASFAPLLLSSLESAPLAGVLEAADIGTLCGAWPSGGLTCSRACLSHFGLPTSSLPSFDQLAAALHPDDEATLMRALAQSIRDGQDRSLDLFLAVPGPAVRRVRLTWRARRSTGDGTGIWDAVTQDISPAPATPLEDANARLHARDHRIAEALQRSLLRPPPADCLAGLDVDTVYRAAWDEALVGGDYYDIFALEEGKVALVVGDVSGKGLEAASRTAEIKYTLRAYLREYPVAATAMERLNAFLCEARAMDAALADTFVCLTLAIVSPHSGHVELCSAGAEPALLLRANGETVRLHEGGLPLGVAAKAEYDSVSVTQEVGDLLLIMTDGLTEARCGQKFLGEAGAERLARRAMEEEGGLSAIGSAILAGAQQFAGGLLHDDICLLLARRTE